MNRISGKCRLIPVLSGVTGHDVPATLRGLVWVELEPFETGLRRLIHVCHDLSLKPPIGAAPPWAMDRPLSALAISPDAQRLAAWINSHSEDGTPYDLFPRDAIVSDLSMTPEQAGMAASELADAGWIELDVDTGSGVAGFSSLLPLPALFFRTDPDLRGWNPEQDAQVLAAAMVNLAADGGVDLATLDKHLGWGPRRINPAADYLRVFDYVEASSDLGSAPYTYSHAFVNHRTKRFSQRQ